MSNLDTPKGPIALPFDKLEAGKSYILSGSLQIFLGPQNTSERSRSWEIGAVIIPAGTKFQVISKKDTFGQKHIRFDNGVEVALLRGCYPKEPIDVIPEEDWDESGAI
jgi:hypothetical protein